MVDDTNTFPLISTKLHRPPIDKNQLHRCFRWKTWMRN